VIEGFYFHRYLIIVVSLHESAKKKKALFFSRFFFLLNIMLYNPCYELLMNQHLFKNHSEYRWEWKLEGLLS